MTKNFFKKRNPLNASTADLLCAECTYVALHDFKSTNDGDLPFKKGEELKVLQA